MVKKPQGKIKTSIPRLNINIWDYKVIEAEANKLGIAVSTYIAIKIKKGCLWMDNNHVKKIEVPVRFSSKDYDMISRNLEKVKAPISRCMVASCFDGIPVTPDDVVAHKNIIDTKKRYVQNTIEKKFKRDVEKWLKK